MLAAWVAMMVAMPAGAQFVITPPFDPPDPSRDQPISPDISLQDLELFGRYWYHWQDGADQALACVGGFTLKLGERVLRADNAIIWMFAAEPPPGVVDVPPIGSLRSPQRRVKDVLVYLEDNAVIQEPGGSETRDRFALVSLKTIGRVQLNGDAVMRQPPPPDWPTLERARKLRVAWEQRLAGGEPEFVEDAALAAQRARQRDQGATVRYSALQTENDVRNGESIVTAIGQVSITQVTGDEEEFLELKADAAVLFLAEDRLDQLGGALGGPPRDLPAAQPLSLRPSGTNGVNEADGTAPPSRPGRPITPAEVQAATQPAGESPFAGQLANTVHGVYLEGDVVIIRGSRLLRARRVYYDFRNDQAVLLDGVIAAFDPEREVPIYVRAEEIKQMARGEFVAKNARLTTSEFRTPSYHIGAETLYLYDTTTRDERGRATAPESGFFEAYNSTFNLEGVPLTYWPYLAADLREQETTLRSLNISYDSDFGLSVETEWYLANLLGVDEPEGWTTTLRLDYFSERGPATGIDIDYVGENYYGLLRTYYINDNAEEDDINPFRDQEIQYPHRGRALWRHRQFLPDDWELTLEASYISDRNFLEAYEEREFFNDKDQETVVYLKKQQNNWAFTVLLNWKILEWLEQTDHVPDVAFRLLGESIMNDTMTYFGEARYSYVRYSGDQGRIFDEGRADNTSNTEHTNREDTRHEVQWPIPVGPIKLVPYVATRATFWDSGPRGEGAIDRYFFSAGLRTQGTFYKVFENIESDLLDVHGIRHVVKPDAVIFFSEANEDAYDLTPFDEGIETISGFGGVLLGIRNRWQTKRGPAGERRVVDYVTLDFEYAGFLDEDSAFDPYRQFPRTNGYFYTSRPEESIATDYARMFFSWQISDQTLVSYDVKVDADDPQVAKSVFALSVQRSPRLSYFVGHEYIGEIDTHLFGYGINYRLNSKYTLAWRQSFDVEESRCIDNTLAVVRKYQRFYTALSLNYDGIADDYSITFSVWPEGAPQAALGSRRFIPLADSVGLRP